MSEKKLVPKLRFSGFDDEWKSCRLHEICNVQDGTHATPNYVDEGIPFYSVETITSDVPPKFITLEEHQKLIKRCKPKFGDILLTRIGTLAKSKIIDWNNEFSIYVSLALLSSIKIDNKFLNQYIKTEIYQKEFLKRSLLLAVPQKINLKDLNETIIKYPSNNEMNKISEFLTKIDKKIELLENKHKNYQNFKKYLMQQIFTQKLRFDFNDEWKKYKLKDVLSVKSSSISINQLEDNEGDYPLYGANGFLKNIDFCEMDVNYISIVKDGSGVGNLSYHKQNSSIVNTSQYLLPKKNFNIHFMYYLLQTLNLKKYINGSSIPHIYFKDYCIEKVDIPSLPEQNQIGRLLLGIDKKLENLNNHIELTNDFKKSLLQQMFV